MSWAAIIAGCVENAEYEGALRLFMEMQSETGNLCKCGDIVDDGIFVFLIKFYGEFGYQESADNVFDHVPRCNTVVWTARIGNLCKEEKFEGTVRIFNEMVREGVKKNSFTFSSVVKACGKLKDAGCCGQQVHATSVKGLLRDALRVFNAREDKSNIACWNAMLMGCIQHGFGVEAMKVLYEMKEAVRAQKLLLDDLMADDVVHSEYTFAVVTGRKCICMICCPWRTPAYGSTGLGIVKEP
ncbi:hypothetical protein RND71_016134 [Anisodus tanguticus]|uniref:Pentatricopeptide repeat-containing protein n=1 Tax=Anisodus tanguticus TaxID=243964 RepID=A0AAE1S998_9SOLA|nr:hypothetical protein RND71_016134 [Anisodus tanguticus]